MTSPATKLQRRVIDAAAVTLDMNKSVSQVDVLIGLGWLPVSAVDRWRQGRLPHLDAAMQINPAKLASALAHFRAWAQDQGLRPAETAYVARTRDRRTLQFSESGDPETELACRTHWFSPELPAEKQQRIAEKQSKPPELVAISPRKAFTCTECGEASDGLLLMEDPGPVCMGCAGLGHLVFLPSGNAALTRRAKKGSALSAVVVRFSTRRKHYERQGLLVEEAALAAAEEQCLADEDARERRRERDRERRATQDVDLQARTAEQIRQLFPGCSAERAEDIARHATVRSSGRIGRTAAGQALEPEAITLAVIASIRHHDTDYEDLLMAGVDRREARQRVYDDVQRMLDSWR